MVKYPLDVHFSISLEVIGNLDNFCLLCILLIWTGYSFLSISVYNRKVCIFVTYKKLVELQLNDLLNALNDNQEHLGLF